MEPKVVVITGASGGIGAALARALGRQGHRLVLAARRAEELQSVAATFGPSAIAVPTDVTKRGDHARLLEQALAAFGHVDVWVNNAGRGLSKYALDLTDDELDEMLLINTKSVLYGMQTVVPHFKQRGSGQLVNVSSFLGRFPMAPMRAGYSAAKAAMNSLTTSVRMELASHPGIHVTLVSPGLVTTEFAANARGGAERMPPPTPGAPTPPSQTPEEVATVIAGVIEVPVPEVYTQPTHRAFARKLLEGLGAI